MWVAVTHLVIPEQEGESDKCLSLNEKDADDYQRENNLLPLGWIHTHPSHSLFMSSIDVHNQFSYQKQVPESMSIVCSIKENDTDFFNLTQDGMHVL